MSPGRPDRRVVERRLLALREAVAVLRARAGVTPRALRADTELRWAVERGLQLCAQNALDIATHLVSAAGLDIPDYRSAIDRLAQLGILSGDFAARFRRVAGFRNVLAHDYMEVDLERVAGMLAGGLEDFEEFARCIDEWLDASAES